MTLSKSYTVISLCKEDYFMQMENRDNLTPVQTKKLKSHIAKLSDEQMERIAQKYADRMICGSNNFWDCVDETLDNWEKEIL